MEAESTNPTAGPVNGNSSCTSTGGLTNPGLIGLYTILAMALVVLVILSFTQKRTKKHNCLFGYPGLPIPMDFLVTPRHRWIYVAVFTVFVPQTFSFFLQLSSVSIDSVYLRLFYSVLLLPMVIILLLALQFFPLTACADAPIPFLGHVLGLIYSLAWFGTTFGIQIAQFVDNVRNCLNLSGSEVDRITIAFDICRRIPIWIISLFIVVWYIYHTILDIVKFCIEFNRRKSLGFDYHIYQDQSQEVSLSDLGRVKRHQFEHVKALLKKPKIVPSRGKVHRILLSIWNYFIPYDRHFRFPVQFIGLVTAMSMLLYQICFPAISYSFVLINKLSVSYENQLRPLLNLTGVVNDVFQTIFVGLPVLLALAPFVSLVICILIVIHMVGSVSKAMKKVAREGFTEELPTKLARVPAAWKYLGLQIGFFVYAWIIYSVLLFVAGVVVAALYFGFRYLTTWTINIALGILVPTIWTQVVFYLQQFICKYVFFDDHEGKFIAITNRRLFSWFAYVLFFYNGFVGFIGAIMRAFISVAFGVILLFRLDHVVLMRGFELFDFGHRAYLGFLYLDYTYNNAVIHVFVNLLKAAIEARMLSSPSSPSSPTEAGGVTSVACVQVLSRSSVSLKRSRSRNRWFVAYTLIRNPSLQKLTASNLNLKKSVDSDKASDGSQVELLAEV